MLGGAGESFMRSGRRSRRHSQSPRAARSQRERRERVSGRAGERWEPGSAEGAPGHCLRSGRSSPPSSVRERSKRQTKSPGAEPGEPAAEAPVPLRRLPCKPGSDRSPPRRPRALHSVPRCPRDGLRAREGLAALLCSRALRLLLTAPGCAPGRPRPEKLVVRAA